AAFQKATSLGAQAGSALNMLGYAYLRQGKADEAIAAFKGYVSAMPNEPNPQDSLAEALMAGGKFTEAEAGFRKAAEISPHFSIARSCCSTRRGTVMPSLRSPAR